MKDSFLQTAHCAECGRTFEKYREAQKYCCNECYRKAYNRRVRKKYDERECRYCKKLFMPTRNNNVYCSIECKNRQNHIEAALLKDLPDVKECFRCRNKFERKKGMSRRDFASKKECPTCISRRKNKIAPPKVARGGFQVFEMPHYEECRVGGRMTHKRLVGGEAVQI